MRAWPAVLAVLALICVSGPAAAEPPGRKTENLILVTTDGLRWEDVFSGADEALLNRKDGGVADVDALKQAYWRDTPEQRREALMPFLWRVVANQGQLFGNAKKGSIARVTNRRNFSYPGYSEMLTGAADSRVDSNAKRANPNINVLGWLNQRPPWQGKVVVAASWDVFPYILNTERTGVLINSGWEPVAGQRLSGTASLLNRLNAETPRMWEDSRYDSFTFLAARELTASDTRVLYVSFDDTDEFAHQGRYDHYLNAAHRVDSYIEQLWQNAQAQDSSRGKTTLVITTDHGRGGAPRAWRDHGAGTPGSDRVWIGVLGPDTPVLGERTDCPDVTQAQVAATLAALLGEDFRAASARAAAPIESVLPSAAR